MTHRVSAADLQQAVANLNNRMDARNARVHYLASGRNGYYGLDRFTSNNEDEWLCQNTVRIGTKTELYEFVYAMMTALDDAEIYSRTE